MKKALRAAFPYTLPILAGYGFLGFTYGILMQTNGFAWYWPFLTATIVYTGSLEFLLSAILLEAFHPASVFILGIMIGARHIFYGISNLERFRGMGWKKFFLIYWESDETFSILWTTDPGPDIDRGWFYFWVSFLDMSYWAIGGLVGNLFGSLVTFPTKGLDFVMTAMFVVIFMDNWMKEKNHAASLIGLGASFVCLLIFGKSNFTIPAMMLIFVTLTAFRRPLEKRIGEAGSREEKHSIPGAVKEGGSV